MDRARADVANKRQSVAQLEAALAAANAALQQAALDASVAAEAYNGAMWRLSEAKKSVRKAEAEEAQAKKDVKDQRSGIVTFVTDSYQNGTELNSATAIMSDEGPKGLMNRYGVVESAGDSMEAALRRFREASVVAKAYTEEGGQGPEAPGVARRRGTRAAQRRRGGRQLRRRRRRPDRHAEGSSWSRRSRKAQNISVELAGERQQALEQIAQEKAAAAAQAKAARGGQGGAAPQGRQAVGPGREVGQAGQPGRRERRQLQRQLVRGRLRRPGPARQRLTARTRHRRPARGRLRQATAGQALPLGCSRSDSFDCSGLTMMAWRAGGKSLPHWSVAQFQQSTRIGVGSLRKGDLVFWGGSPGSIHHVAMYIGNGQIIHAPRTGQPVQINSMYYWVPPNYFARP